MARLARTITLASLLSACGRAGADTTPPEPVSAAPQPTREIVDEPGASESAPASDDPAVVQRIAFDGDDPEPPAELRAAPKRPPIPRFQLFGTRPTDGP